VEQERFTLSEHLSSPPVFSVIRVARSLVFCIVFYRLLYVPLANVLSDLQFTDIDYPFDFVKLFLREINREKLNFNKYSQVLRKGEPLLFHQWNTSCYSSNKPGNKSCIKKGPGSTNDKGNINFDRTIL
jgi:hypothetical protein